MSGLRKRIRGWLGLELLDRQIHQLYLIANDIYRALPADRLVGIRMAKEFADLKEMLMRNMETYNAAINALSERVAQLTTVEDSAVALINGLRERINQLVTESDGIVPVEELQKLTSSIDVGTQKLAAALTENTAPAPVEETTLTPAEEPPAGNPAET